MDFMEIAKIVENNKTKLSSSDLVNLVIVATVSNDVINCNTISEVIKGLQSVKKAAMQDFKDAQSEQLKADKKIIADKVKEWFFTLKVGEPISWHDSKTLTPIFGTVGEQKKDAKRAHVILNEIPSNTKSKNPRADRYIPFENLFMPKE